MKSARGFAVGTAAVVAVAVGLAWVSTRPEPEVTHVRVLATTDLHGALESTADPADETRLVGGFAVLKATMDTAEARCGCTALRVDAGDQLQGTLTSNLSHGAATVTALNELGLDAAAIGNHEFDWSVDTLRARLREAQYPWLVANVFDSVTGARPEWARPYHLADLPGLRVAYIGFVASGTKAIVYAPHAAGLVFGAGRAAIADVLEEVRAEDPDLTILTAHAGGFCDDGACRGEIISLAEELVPGEVDLIVAGHTHQTMATVVNGIPIVQAGANGRALGVVDLFREAGRGWRAQIEIEPVVQEQITPDAGMRELVAALGQTADSLAGQHVATLAAGPETREELGNAIADSQRQVAEADVALMNAGGVRASLPAGAITYEMLYRVLPFGNRLVRLTVSGSELRRVLEQTLGGESVRGFVSGVRVTLSSEQGTGNRIVDLRVGDRLVVDDGTYTLAVSDYLAEGGDGLETLTSAPREDIGATTLEALIWHLQAAPDPFVFPPALRVTTVQRRPTGTAF